MVAKSDRAFKKSNETCRKQSLKFAKDIDNDEILKMSIFLKMNINLGKLELDV